MLDTLCSVAVGSPRSKVISNWCRTFAGSSAYFTFMLDSPWMMVDQPWGTIELKVAATFESKAFFSLGSSEPQSACSLPNLMYISTIIKHKTVKMIDLRVNGIRNLLFRHLGNSAQQSFRQQLLKIRRELIVLRLHSRKACQHIGDVLINHFVNILQNCFLKIQLHRCRQIRPRYTQFTKSNTIMQ